MTTEPMRIDECLPRLPRVEELLLLLLLLEVEVAAKRAGKWPQEECADRLIQEFEAGLLPLTDGTTFETIELRSHAHQKVCAK
jgi:hypothetical protein